VSKPLLIHRTGKHRVQRLRLAGNPAVFWIEKPIREKI
jgi:hypothetical protein